MTTVFSLTITADHDFGRIVHHSMHSSAANARAFADEAALPYLREREDSEWHDCFAVSIESFTVDPVSM